MTRPALTLAATGSPRVVSRTAALVACAYWDQAELMAFDAMLAVPIGSTAELEAAHNVLQAVQEQRAAADRRLRRADCEAAGVRWLRLARPGERADG